MDALEDLGPKKAPSPYRDTSLTKEKPEPRNVKGRRVESPVLDKHGVAAPSTLPGSTDPAHPPPTEVWSRVVGRREKKKSSKGEQGSRPGSQTPAKTTNPSTLREAEKPRKRKRKRNRKRPSIPNIHVVILTTKEGEIAAAMKKAKENIKLQDHQLETQASFERRPEVGNLRQARRKASQDPCNQDEGCSW